MPGADPVTGELLPVAGLADLAHAHGAVLVVDATLLAPAGRLDLAATGADHAVVTAAALPLPAAGAALVGRPLDPAPVPVPSGTSRLPDGAWLGLAQLADLADLPDGVLAAHVAGLRAALVTGLRQLPGVRILQHWPDATAHAGVLGLAVDGWTPRLLARRLGLDAAGDGVQVRLDAETTTVAVGGLLDALEDVVTSAAPTP